MDRLSYLISVVALWCAALAAAPPKAEEKIEISGGWIFTVEIVGNTGAPVFVFKQEGDKLKGTYRGRFGEADLKGTVEGDKIEFSFEIQGNTIAYSGTIKKDGMEGEADYAGQATATWKGKRIDLSGTWNVESEIGEKARAAVFTLKQDGDKLSGTCKDTSGEADVKGTVKGDKVDFTLTIDGHEVTYKGTIDKDAIKGEADYAGQGSGTFSGTRNPEK